MTHNRFPTVEEAASLAHAGESVEGAYDEAREYQQRVLGPEADRYALLTAALSPSTPFPRETARATQALGIAQKMRGKSRKEVESYIDSLTASGKLKKLLPSQRINLVRAIMAPDPTAKGVIEGPKVGPYASALQGSKREYPADSMITRLHGVLPRFGKNRGRDKINYVPTQKDRDEILSFMPSVVEHINKGREGRKKRRVTPSSLQASQWGGTRSYFGHIGREHTTLEGLTKHPKEILPHLWHEEVASKATFPRVLFDPTYSEPYENLEALGYGPQLKAAREHWFDVGRKEYNKFRGRLIDTLGPEIIEAMMDWGIRQMSPKAARRHRKLTLRKKGRKRKYAAQSSGSMIAVPPNVQEGMTFESALNQMRSANQKAFKEIIQKASQTIGIKPHLENAIGDWTDGAEHSVLQRIHEPIDSKTADYLAAWYGLLANQKSVLVFQPQHNGPDSTYEVDVPDSDLSAVRNNLDSSGVPFRTIVPTKKGTRVVVYDQGRQLRDNIAQFGAKYNATILESQGAGRFIGGRPGSYGASSRSEARANYRRIITAYEARSGRPAANRYTQTESGPVPSSIPSGDSNNRGAKSGKEPVKMSRTGIREFVSRLKDSLKRTDPAEARKRKWQERDRRAKELQERVKEGRVQAPAGGMLVRGIYYPGGRMVPSKDYESEQKARYARGDISGALSAEADRKARIKYAADEFSGAIPMPQPIPRTGGPQAIPMPTPLPRAGRVLPPKARDTTHDPVNTVAGPHQRPPAGPSAPYKVVYPNGGQTTTQERAGINRQYPSEQPVANDPTGLNRRAGILNAGRSAVGATPKPFNPPSGPASESQTQRAVKEGNRAAAGNMDAGDRAVRAKASGRTLDPDIARAREWGRINDERRKAAGKHNSEMSEEFANTRGAIHTARKNRLAAIRDALKSGTPIQPFQDPMKDVLDAARVGNARPVSPYPLQQSPQQSPIPPAFPATNPIPVSESFHPSESDKKDFSPADLEFARSLGGNYGRRYLEHVRQARRDLEGGSKPRFVPRIDTPVPYEGMAKAVDAAKAAVGASKTARAIQEAAFSGPASMPPYVEYRRQFLRSHPGKNGNDAARAYAEERRRRGLKAPGERRPPLTDF